MKRKTWICLVLAVTLAAPSPLSAATTHTTGPLDREEFQALVNRVEPGDTIACQGGVYEFAKGDPVRIDKRLRIVAATPDDPPVFRGVREEVPPADGEGTEWRPVSIDNDAFTVYGLEEDLSHLEFEGLHFEYFWRPLSFYPNHHPPTCDDPYPADLHQLRVTGCSFVNTQTAVHVVGGGKNLNLVGNTARTGSASFFLVGGHVYLPFGVSCDTQPPRLALVEGNTLTGGLQVETTGGLIASNVEGIRIVDNTIQGQAFGIHLSAEGPPEDPTRLGKVTRNKVSATGGMSAAIVVLGPATIEDSALSKNSIFDSPLFGIYLAKGANHFKIDHNEFDDSSAVHIYLDGVGLFGPPASHDNQVIATDPSVRVVDLGVNNRVVR